MKLSRIQNIVIIALVIAAVFQTGKLWLYSNDSYNFFYTIFRNFDKNSIRYAGETYPIEPTEIFVGFGNKKFSKFYSNSDENGIYEQGVNAIFEIFEQGRFSSQYKLNWEDILLYKNIMFKYAKSINISDFKYSFYKKYNDNDKIFLFDTIVIYPQMNYSSILKVIFINSQDNNCFEYSILDSKYAQNVYNIIEKQQNEEIKLSNNITYISTKQSGFNIFSNNTFVPQWSGNEFYYNYIKRINPFESNNIFSLNLLESYVDNFFENNNSKWIETDETGAYLFSDDNVVVKYLSSGILEYYNYEPYENKFPQNFITSYSVAKNFLKTDSSLRTDVYLLDWNFNDDEITYYFNYTINNMPIIPSEIFSNIYNMNSCIEITVKNNNVKKYRRIAYNYEKDAKVSYINKEFIKAIDEAVMLKYQKDNEKFITNVDNISLGYYMGNRDVLKLRWFTTIEDKIYITDSNK